MARQTHPRNTQGIIRHLTREARLFDIPGQAVIATDTAGTIVFWGREAERLYGWKRDEVLGRDVVEVTPSDLSREQAIEIMERLRRGQSWTGDFHVRHKTGATFHARVMDVPVRSAAGELIGIVGVSRPVAAVGKPDMRTRTHRQSSKRPASD